MLSAITGKLWQYLAAASAIAAGVLWFLWKIADAEREVAETKRDVAEANLQATEKVREKTRKVSEAKQRARERAKIAEKTLAEHRRTGKRPASFGDDRLQEGGDDA